jgi:hypothetical protein
MTCPIRVFGDRLRIHLVNSMAVLAVLLCAVTPASAQITITYTFTNGQAADADQVNANFAALSSQALNRTGGTLTGNLAANAGVTIDGVDVGAVLGGTGTPTFSTVTVTSAAASALTVTGGITAGSGVVGIVDTTGKIPALSSTFFANLSGANLTALSATNISTGTLAMARGGTGADFSGTTVGNLFYFSGTGALGTIAPVAAGSFLRSAGAAIPTWSTDGSTLTALNATQLTTGTLPSARFSGTYSNALTFSGGVTLSANVNLSAGYFQHGSQTTATITTPNATIDPTTGSVVIVSNADPANSIQTISGGIEGRELHVCVSGSPFILSAGGNIVSSSGGISNGSCITLMYHSGAWWFFD